MAAEVFTAGVVSGAFAAGISEAFAAGVLGTFTAGISEAFAAGVLETFTDIAVFSAMIVFSFPVSVSMGTRGGGIGVIPIDVLSLAIAEDRRSLRFVLMLDWSDGTAFSTALLGSDTPAVDNSPLKKLQK